MQYRMNQNGEPISTLGFGCMRFTRSGSKIDIDKAEKEILEAYNAGVNYYDTAYIYPGSEVAVGEIFERNNLRDKVSIATKLPQYLCNSRASVDKYFNEQLSRLRTNYIDYYLMHFMTDFGQWEKLKSLGICEWIAEKKQSGEIKYIGFSFHGNTEDFLKILNNYEWDFCQIQYNYLDVTAQAGVDGLKAAAEKGIPVIIMEPLRGGKLVDKLPEEAKKLIAESDKGYKPAELALKWLWNQPEVTCVLSGMNSVEMVQENCRTADETIPGSFDEADFALVDKVKKIIVESTKIGCTECRYCMPCPKGVEIPGLFRCYNRSFTEGWVTGKMDYIQTIALRGEPAFAKQCVGCGICEKHCPQGIKIREQIKIADRYLIPFYLKPIIPLARFFMLKKKKNQPSE